MVQEGGVGEEDLVGMIESKEQPNDGNGEQTTNDINVSNTATAAATTTTISSGQNLSHDDDSHAAVTHHSFFHAVIVPSCQPGNVICSASQHRYTHYILFDQSIFLFFSIYLTPS